MNLGTIKLNKIIPTEPGSYFWQNDVLHKRGCFVEVVDMGGRLSYLCPSQHEWVDVDVFKKSQWSEKLHFVPELAPEPPQFEPDEAWLIELLVQEALEKAYGNGTL